MQFLNIKNNFDFLSSWEPETNIDADALILEFETAQLQNDPLFKRRNDLTDVAIKYGRNNLLLQKGLHLDMSKDFSDSSSDDDLDKKQIKLF